MNWLHLGPVMFATFLASFVEFVEALTIVLAVGTTRNWKSALYGTTAAVVALILLIALARPFIEQVPVQWMQLVIGAIVAIFGLKWLKKATLRSAGRIPMHDEDAEFSREVKAMGAGQLKTQRLDKIAVATTFKAVFLEGFEVAFIVITAGSVSRNYVPALVGAAGALMLVIALGLALHKPLSRVPENAMKKSVGILLTSFGLFWFGEGIGLRWPLGDGTILVLIAIFTAASLGLSRALRTQVRK